ncbi:hypothetical protein [Thermotalea metallivorans]|uniref:Uncharacterized protein n=1 Tax=Thermotalea metallivorans TaxID=520762 RepID=A0A140KZH9_9FIRM|nr:hypothetical protein [Thermotalea metallivorans]KXG73704.1 hypothetical protein AN619_29990 [Thermotalea metallivorans]
MKQKNYIFVLVLMAIFILSAGVSYGLQYYLSCDSDLDAYGYGVDFMGSTEAVQVSNGGWTDITGVKVRCIVYENGVKDTDTSASDTTPPYKAILNGSCSSTRYSNVWKMTVTHYGKEGNSTYYEPSISYNLTDSN